MALLALTRPGRNLTTMPFSFRCSSIRWSRSGRRSVGPGRDYRDVRGFGKLRSAARRLRVMRTRSATQNPPWMGISLCSRPHRRPPALTHAVGLSRPTLRPRAGDRQQAAIAIENAKPTRQRSSCSRGRASEAGASRDSVSQALYIALAPSTARTQLDRDRSRRGASREPCSLQSGPAEMRALISSQPGSLEIEGLAALEKRWQQPPPLWYRSKVGEDGSPT
jgi:hypothetical protein